MERTLEKRLDKKHWTPAVGLYLLYKDVKKGTKKLNFENNKEKVWFLYQTLSFCGGLTYIARKAWLKFGHPYWIDCMDKFF